MEEANEGVLRRSQSETAERKTDVKPVGSSPANRIHAAQFEAVTAGLPATRCRQKHIVRLYKIPIPYILTCVSLLRCESCFNFSKQTASHWKLT